jgi:asparagine synthase (glutamine-hydrolysing)
LRIVKPTKKDFLKHNKEIIYYMDTPPTWTSFTLFMLTKQIKQDGFKVVLSGEGADELFGGYYRYLLIHHDELLKKVPQMKNYQFLINKYHGSIIDRYTKIINRGDSESKEFLKEFLKEFHINSKDSIDFMGMVDFYTTMQILLQMADRLSFANQIENRSPFLDHRIIEFAFSLDKKYKIKDYTTKYLLKKVAKKFIPNEIVNRIDKRGFSAPINRWFGEAGYDRSFYKNLVFQEWKGIFNV